MKSGFVSILGRPNAGKSTLVNALTGEKVAIVTSKPQTTRTRIHGIVEVKKTRKRAAAQIVFVDTPGVHKPSTMLDKQMMQAVHDALASRAAVLLMIDASRYTPLQAHDKESEDAFVLGLVRKLDCPVLLVINKVDLVEREKLLPMITELTTLHSFAEVFLISARKRDGLEALLEKLVGYLPEGERYFPPDQFTDQPERFLAAELIRERILMETGEEVPYASAVVIEQWEEPPTPTRKPKPDSKLPLTRIAAAIYCEREGQKAILIGKGGAKLKAIGASARVEIERLLGTRVFLQLHIIVEENWREKRGFLDTLDWRREIEERSRRLEMDPKEQ